MPRGREWTLQPGTGAVAFGFLAHDQCIQIPLLIGSGHGNTADQWVGAKGEASHGDCIGLHVREHGATDQGQAGTAQAHGFAVHVVLALSLIHI